MRKEIVTYKTINDNPVPVISKIRNFRLYSNFNQIQFLNLIEGRNGNIQNNGYSIIAGVKSLKGHILLKYVIDTGFRVNVYVEYKSSFTNAYDTKFIMRTKMNEPFEITLRRVSKNKFVVSVDNGDSQCSLHIDSPVTLLGRLFIKPPKNNHNVKGTTTVAVNKLA